jgi:hypothetical protein
LLSCFFAADDSWGRARLPPGEYREILDAAIGVLEQLGATGRVEG